MGYFDHLEAAARWLVAHRNSNKGWGMSPGQASSIVNTAEAVYVLTRAGFGYHREINEGLAFIEQRLFTSIKSSGPRTRYAQFALLTLQEHPTSASHDFVTRCIDWMFGARNADGGWGHGATDGQSKLFPTALSIIVLSSFISPDKLSGAFHWIQSKRSESGWRFTDDAPVSPTATAVATLALRKTVPATDPVFQKPRDFLLSTTHWGNERENLPGTLWDHCTYMWIFPALVSLGINPYAPTIAEGVRFVNSLGNKNGWTEPAGGESIRGQFWAVYSLDALQKAFDPAIHIYRIDSERTQNSLTEPEFVNIQIHSRWAMIIPHKLYKWAAYGLLMISFIAFFGLHRKLNPIGRYADYVASIACFLTAYVMFRKRNSLFHKWTIWLVPGIVLVLEFIDLVFGVSVVSIFAWLNGKL